MTAPPPTAATPLFGGALSALLPASFLDVSTLRQVPDNQEVWVDTTASPDNNDKDSASLIIELLHLDPDVSHSALATFHLSQVLLSDDTANEPQYQLLDVSSLDTSTCPIASTSGYPIVIRRVVARVTGLHKFNQRAAAGTSPVLVLLWVVRIPHVETDVVITWNLPHGVPAPGVPGGPPGPPVDAVANVSPTLLQACEVVLRSLTVHDWGLFC